uniref:Ethylene-responsive transcription factor CRF1 n=1 Tax=Aegilops tauschii TaxID=37682 RepID=M8CSC0_AEGTA
MPPRRRETWGYRGVRACPSGGFSAEFRFRRMRLGLGNFDTANEAARAYDATAWRLRWPRRTLNFPNMPTRERAQELVPLPRLITDEDRRDNRRREHRLGIAEMDEEAMALWRQRFPQDNINEREFYEQRRAERDKRRAERAAYREDKRRQKADTQFNMRLGAASP